MRLTRHLVLVGLPGAGKTTVGRDLAGRLGLPFIDFDEEITRREGAPITDIFASRGEPYFRALEAELTREVAGKPPMVVSPGGGWIVQPRLVEMLRPPALLVHLAVSPGEAVRRMGSEVAARPLLGGATPTERVVTLWEERRTAYTRADIHVATDLFAAQEVSDEVLRLIERSVEAGS